MMTMTKTTLTIGLTCDLLGLIAYQIFYNVKIPSSFVRNDREQRKEGEAHVNSTEQGGDGVFSSSEHLPFHPWELESSLSRTCRPPPGIPEVCCIGSFSASGRVKFVKDKCVDKPYDETEIKAKAMLEQLVLPENGGEIKCDVCQVVNQLVRNNITLTFQGDSISRQSFIGFQCELFRRGYNVSVIHEPTNKTDTRWRYGITDRTKLIVRTGIGSAIINFFAIYRPIEDMKEVADIFRQSDVVVFDHGFHYLERERSLFQQLLIALALTRQMTGSPAVLAWRETSSQHYKTRNGDWTDNLNFSNPEERRCVPTKTEESDNFRFASLSNFQDATGYSVADASDPDFLSRKVDDDELVFLPFQKFTRSMHNLHPSDTDDCSHFCSTPYLWLPIWRMLRLAIDRAYA